MNRILLSDDELKNIQSLLREIASQYRSAGESDFLNEVSIFAHELPRRIRAQLNDFCLTESDGVCIISGYPINQSKIGKTPSHWKWKAADKTTLEEQILLVLYGALLGYAFGWATQQNGHIIHDVLPIKGHENEQLGSGSDQLLWWHTEDAFHPYRADYVSFLCLRNPDKVVTTFAKLDISQLTGFQKELLFEPHFIIYPDESHLEKNASLADETTIQSIYRKINQMNTDPKPVPVLFGDPQSPYLCMDPYFMKVLPNNEAAQSALGALIAAINANLSEMILKPGDYCFIDNYKVVHGRKPFRARYDGMDRWLKRINITRDLRKSRNARITCTSRIIL